VKIETIDIKCFYCGEDSASTISLVKDYCLETCDNIFQYVKCNICENIYLKNRPKLEYLDKIYPQNYSTYDYKKYLGFFINFFRNKFQEKKIKIIDSHLKSDDLIIDIGSGGGDFLKVYKKISNKKLQFFGLDFSDYACQTLLKNNIHSIKKRFEDLEDDAFSEVGAITMFQMIEHVDDPLKNIKKTSKILRKGGVFVIETPNINSWDYKIFKHNYWAGWHAPRHWNILENKFLVKILKESNFEIISNTCVANPYAWLHSFQYLLKYKYKLKKISKIFEVNNFLMLAFFTLVDILQICLTKNTSNTQIIAKKI
jgi:SAM-dependent methyltransferase